MKSYQQFFAELKRRHVFKVAAIYGGVSFALLQVADPLASALRLPDTFVPFVVALLLLGFPVALVLAWAFEVTPEGVQRTQSASAAEIDEIVAQPISKRWPSGILALLGVLALVAGAWWAGRQSATPATGASAEGRADSVQLAYAAPEVDDARPSIAVLPFADMSREGDQEYFSDGMTEEILNTLARIDDLRVSARTSTFAYKGRKVDLREIGRELGVRYVVEGSVRKDGDQLRITAQLIDASDGSHLWSDSYDRTLESVFAIQTEIAEAIADELRVPLGLEDPSELVRPVSDFDAYDLYLAARARARERGEALNEAIRLFEAAIAVDSSWAPAWAGLAEAREIRLWYPEAWADSGRPDSATVAAELRAAEEAARRSLHLDPDQASAHIALGSVYRDRYEWADAERHYRTALQLDPDNAEVHHQYGELMMGMGRSREAVLAATRAVSLDPAPVRWNIFANILEADDRPAQARLAFERGIAADPSGTFPALRGNYARVLFTLGDYDALYALVASTSPEDREFVAWLESGEIENVPREVRSDLPPEAWLVFGYPDSAAVFLTERWEPPFEFNRLYALWNPWFDPIRSHPRVLSYLRSVGLEGATLDRTPPDERTMPIVLRSAADAGTP